MGTKCDCVMKNVYECFQKKEHINIYIRENVKEKRLEFSLAKFHQSFSTNPNKFTKKYIYIYLYI